MNAQLSLFGPAAPVVPASQRPGPPAARRGGRVSASPAVAADLLAEISEGRFGLLDDTDHVVAFIEPDRVRKALDADLVHHLMAVGLVQRCPAREGIPCRHGTIRRPVTPLRLTGRGRAQLNRWAALKPLPNLERKDT